MDYTPEQVAFQMTRGYTSHPDFAVAAKHVAKVLPMRKPAYGSYDICSWPTNAQQRTILDLAFSDYRAARANAPKVIPCPEPSPSLTVHESMGLDATDPRTADHGWRRGLDAAARLESRDGRWYGFTPWGVAFAAGLEYGLWFVDWKPAS